MARDIASASRLPPLPSATTMRSANRHARRRHATAATRPLITPRRRCAAEQPPRCDTLPTRDAHATPPPRCTQPPAPPMIIAIILRRHAAAMSILRRGAEPCISWFTAAMPLRLSATSPFTRCRRRHSVAARSATMPPPPQPQDDVYRSHAAATPVLYAYAADDASPSAPQRVADAARDAIRPPPPRATSRHVLMRSATRAAAPSLRCRRARDYRRLMPADERHAPPCCSPPAVVR